MLVPMEIRTSQVQVKTPDGVMPAYLAEPTAPGRHPAVIVVMEAFGLNHNIEEISRRIAGEGYVALAPDVYYRWPDNKARYDELPKAIGLMQKLDDKKIVADVGAALDFLAARPNVNAAKTGITGFCMGGTVALLMDTERDFGAAVTFYGGGVKEGRFGFPPLVEAAPRLRAPWLGLFGDKDTGIPVDQVEELRAAAATSGVTTEIVRYAEAEHGFHCDQRASYHAESARDGWRRTLEWFGRYLTA